MGTHSSPHSILKMVTFAVVVAIVLLAGLILVTEVDPQFSDGFESGSIDPERWQIDSSGNCSIEVVDEKARHAKKAARFSSEGDSRCELVPHTITGAFANLRRKFVREPFKHDRWYEFSTYLTAPWPVWDDDVVLAQWHSSPDKYIDEPFRGPPLALRIVGNYFRISYGWDDKLVSSQAPIAINTLWYAPLETEKWIDWAMHVRWSHTKDGVLQIWKNDQLIVDHEGPNVFNDLRGVYLKLGVYHPGPARTAYFDKIYVGDNKSSAVKNTD